MQLVGDFPDRLGRAEEKPVGFVQDEPAEI